MHIHLSTIPSTASHFPTLHLDPSLRSDLESANVHQPSIPELQASSFKPRKAAAAAGSVDKAMDIAAKHKVPREGHLQSPNESMIKQPYCILKRKPIKVHPSNACCVSRHLPRSYRFINTPSFVRLIVYFHLLPSSPSFVIRMWVPLVFGVLYLSPFFRLRLWD